MTLRQSSRRPNAGRLESSHPLPPRRRAQVFRPLRGIVLCILATVAAARVFAGAERDALGEKEMAAAADPTFDSVAAHMPEMRFPREVIGLKDDPAETAILPDGALGFVSGGGEYSFAPLDKQIHAFLEMAVPPPSKDYLVWHRFGSGEGYCRKRLVEGYLPIVVSEYTYDGLTYEQTALGWSEGMSIDAPLFAVLRVRVSNPGEKSRTSMMRYRMESGTNESTNGRTVAEWTLSLTGKGSQSVFLKIPLGDPAAGATEIKGDEFDRCRADASKYWKNLLSEGMEIRVPEQRINEAWRAWLAYNCINTDKVGDVYEPRDGGGYYEMVYGYSAILYCNALDQYGYHDDARRYLDSLFTFVSPEGLIAKNVGPLDTGALLQMIYQHYELTGDEEWLRRVSPVMVRMCNWIANARKAAMAEQDPESPVRGLLKYRPYCDDPVPAYSYLTDTYLCVGLESAAKGLRRVGLEKEAEEAAAEAANYRAAIERSMRLNVFEHEGTRLLPMYPETRKLLKDNGYTGADYYGLVACMVLETGFLSPTDELAQCIVNTLETRGGLLLGVSTFQGGIDHAYTYGYWMNCLERGLVKPAILGLYSSMAHGSTRATYSSVEINDVREGKNWSTLPHMYSNTQQLRLLRNMLICEKDDELQIAPAIPRHWLSAGSRVAVTHAPTKFGEVSYTIESDGACSATVRLSPPVRKAPSAIHATLRHPEGWQIKAARTVAGQNVPFAGETLQLPVASEPVTALVEFERDSRPRRAGSRSR